MDYDMYVANRRDRMRARTRAKNGGPMKVIGAALLLALLAAFTIGVYAVLAAGPTMLVLGALHTSNGMAWVPALGFWQTLGSLFVIGSIGRSFSANTTTTSSKS